MVRSFPFFSSFDPFKNAKKRKILSPHTASIQGSNTPRSSLSATLLLRHDVDIPSTRARRASYHTHHHAHPYHVLSGYHIHQRNAFSRGKIKYVLFALLAF
jgi:hypothetical protein